MFSAARTIPQAIRWVNESFLPAFLRALRRSSSRPTSSVRKLVAVGIERLSFMKRARVAAGARGGRRGGAAEGCGPGGGGLRGAGGGGRSLGVAVALDRALHVLLRHAPARA